MSNFTHGTSLLQAELELVDFHVNQYNQSRRRIPRSECKERTTKRRLLEKVDISQSLIINNKKSVLLPESNLRKKKNRLRGSKIALEDEVVKGSLFLGGIPTIINGKECSGYRVDAYKDYKSLKDKINKYHKYNNIEEENSYENRQYGNNVDEMNADDLNISDVESDKDGIEISSSSNEIEGEKKNLGCRRVSNRSENINSQFSKCSLDQNERLIPGKTHVIESHKIKSNDDKHTSRCMYRLKNFKSHRLAQQHGDALGSHARGMNLSAVTKLKNVASAAPIAPQIYSSLGLVYENIVKENIYKDIEKFSTATENNKDDGTESYVRITTQMSLSKRAYGSYHVAALLCKRDYNLWVRSGDTALEMANFHSFCMMLPSPSFLTVNIKGDNNADTVLDTSNINDNNNNNNRNVVSTEDEFPSISSTVEERLSHHRFRRNKWLNEALDDYRAADHLHPPGISVPAKLAHVYIELGNLTEALTILTDLKNDAENYRTQAFVEKERNRTMLAINMKTKDLVEKPRTQNETSLGEQDKLKTDSRSEMERSYDIWILYSNLMLRIGYECFKWNRGIHNNENYMFKRWLRKHSSSFDWRERRLQSLCMALEAAAGSFCCVALVSWMRKRIFNSAVIRKDDEKDFERSLDNLNKNSISCEDHENQLNCDKREGIYCVTNLQCESKSTVLSSLKTSNLSSDDMAQDDKSLLFSISSCLSSSKNINSELVDLENSFGHDRTSLLTQNMVEESMFDKETIAMNLETDTSSAKERLRLRDEMKRKHKTMILEMVGTYQSKKLALDSLTEATYTYHFDNFSPIPMSSSCSTVCDIAVKLIKQCLVLGLYRGGRLVTEAVLNYFRARALRHEKNRERAKFLDKKRIESNMMVQLNTEHYDDIENNLTDESDECDFIISDEDIFENDSGKGMMESMKKGALPYEISLLYGLSLIGEGDKVFLATKMIYSIKYLEEVTSSHLEQSLIDTNIKPDMSWVLFRRVMIDPLDKLSAFAFVADLIQKMGNVDDFIDILLDLFVKYFNNLISQGDVDLLIADPSRKYLHNMPFIMKKNQLLKVLIAIMRMKLLKAGNLTSIGSASHMNREECSGSKKWVLAQEHADEILRKFLLYKDSLWKITSHDTAMKNMSVEVLKIITDAMNVLMEFIRRSDGEKQNARNRNILPLLSKMRYIVSLICNVRIPNHMDVKASSSSMFAHSWRHFPIPCEWQSNFHRDISKCVFNFCVSCNVSTFSGWSEENFCLRMLKTKCGPRYLGIQLHGTKVTGHLSNSLKTELSWQWKTLQNIIPTLPNFDFNNDILDEKKAEWFNSAMNMLNTRCKNIEVAEFGEELALSILVSFSYLCLIVAENEKDHVIEEDLIKCSLSVIIPMSQFCLYKKIWNSEIGNIAVDDENFNEWENFVEMTSKFQGSFEDDSPKPEYTPKIFKERSNFSQFRKMNKYKAKISVLECPLSGLIKVPISILFKEWIVKDDFNGHDYTKSIHLNKWSEQCTGPAKLAMKNLDCTIQKMRECVTINALQNASLQVGAALIEVASKKECYNPFMCLQHAAFFASQGSKGGNNDELFKKVLPLVSKCTVYDSLNILGRADCLRAIHFTDESIFLCSFVARVCSLHRDIKQTRYLWTPQWRVIGIMTFTLSVYINSTICSLMRDDARKTALKTWGRDVKEEIEHGKYDAICLTQEKTAEGRFNSQITKNKLNEESSVKERIELHHTYDADLKVTGFKDKRKPICNREVNSTIDLEESLKCEISSNTLCTKINESKEKINIGSPLCLYKHDRYSEELNNINHTCSHNSGGNDTEVEHNKIHDDVRKLGHDNNVTFEHHKTISPELSSKKCNFFTFPKLHIGNLNSNNLHHQNHQEYYDGIQKVEV